MSDPLLTVRNLFLSFGGTVALDEVSFALKAGQIAALVGPPGAGKTSIINCLSGFYRPQSGRMEMRGDSTRLCLLERMEPWRIAREARLIRTFRNPRLFAGLTVLENVLVAEHSAMGALKLFSTSFSRKSARRARERAQHWLERLGLAHLAGRSPAELDFALRRRVEIARALALKPQLLCLDEPLIDLAERERDDLAERLLQLRRAVPAILLTAHDMAIPGAICDHVVLLDHGICHAAGAPHEMAGNAALLRACMAVPAGRDSVPRIAAAC